MLRESPLPPLVLSSVLALGIALIDPRTQPQADARPTTPIRIEDGVRDDASGHPGVTQASPGAADPVRGRPAPRPPQARKA